jgi:2-polyprenyl-3-methyl-5-hydroxy-6-metoxy-1,4-benzoquinol methylase
VDKTELACAICGARDTIRLYTKFEWGIERCRQCGLVYANPRAPEDAILKRYSRDYFWNEYLPAVGAPGGRVDLDANDARHAAMLQLIRSRAADARRLLDVGTGAGLFLKAAERAGWEAAGLELSEAGAAFASEMLHVEVRQERAEAMSFPPGSFDVAVMFDVVEHLFDPRRVLEATRRALRPGGLFVVSTPNFDALSRFVLGVDWAVLSPLEHVYYFTEATLARMLAVAGFGHVEFVRRFAGAGAAQTMNFQYTHAAHHWRTRAYRAVVTTIGPQIKSLVQGAGRADGLLAVASA